MLKYDSIIKKAKTKLTVLSDIELQCEDERKNNGEENRKLINSNYPKFQAKKFSSQQVLELIQKQRKKYQQHKVKQRNFFSDNNMSDSISGMEDSDSGKSISVWKLSDIDSIKSIENKDEQQFNNMKTKISKISLLKKDKRRELIEHLQNEKLKGNYILKILGDQKKQ